MSREMSNPIKIGVCGASGRMGQMLIEAILNNTDCTLAAALDIASSRTLGQDAGDFMGRKTGVLVQADIAAAVAKSDVLIDFTRPEGTLTHLAACAAAGKQMVIGTTGFDAAGKATIAAAGEKTALVFAANMSTGMTITLKLLELAGKSLNTGYDVEVVEAHHRNKVDAPSGTALLMGETVARAMGRDHDAVAVFDRKGHTGARRDDSIGYAVVRGGDVVGDHTVLFLGAGERIEIAHKSSSRAGYAHGALRACRFLRGQTRGVFDMQDVLGLRND